MEALSPEKAYVLMMTARVLMPLNSAAFWLTPQRNTLRP